MEENKKIETNQEVDLLDYLKVLVKYRKMILRNVFVVLILVAFISLLLPKTYTAVTTLLPPDENQQAGILATLSNSPISNLLMNETGTTSDLYVQIIKSRTVLDGVLKEKYVLRKKNKKNTLLEILDVKSLEKGRIKLESSFNATASQEGIIKIEVELKDAVLAAGVANTFVKQLDKVNKGKNTSRAKNSRIYIENQLNMTDLKLKKASEELVEFKEKYKAISLEEQTKAAIENAAELKGSILAKNVELGVALQTMKLDNVIIVKIKKEIEELEKQYNYLQYGNQTEIKEKEEFFIPFADVPEVGLELANLMREVKVQETVWELLNQQYFHAKIQEARDTPTIQVLDEAVPPELRTKPKRKILVLVGGFLALLLSIFYAFVLEFYQNVKKDSDSNFKIKEMIGDIKKDWHEIKKIKLKKVKNKQ